MKKLLLSLVLSLFVAPAFSQTILRYGGMALSKETLTAPVTGVFLAPMGQFGYTPFSLQNNIIELNNTITVDFAYCLVSGTVAPESNGAVAIIPNWFVGGFIGGGSVQNNAINLGHGIIGIDVGKPSLLGNIAVAGAYDLDNRVFSIGIGTMFSFDLLDGLGVIQL